MQIYTNDRNYARGKNVMLIEVFKRAEVGIRVTEQGVTPTVRPGVRPKGK